MSVGRVFLGSALGAVAGAGLAFAAEVEGKHNALKEYGGWYAAAGALLGAVLGSIEKKPAASGALPAPSGLIEDASSTNSLTHGWMYYLTLVDGAGVGALGVAQAVQQAGFVDPNTKAAPKMTGGPGIFKTLAIFNGATGSSVPPSTQALVWATVLGFPEPEVLMT